MLCHFSSGATRHKGDNIRPAPPESIIQISEYDTIKHKIHIIDNLALLNEVPLKFS